MSEIHIGQVAEAANFWDSNTFATLLGVVIASLITGIGSLLARRASNQLTAKLIVAKVAIMLTNLKALNKHVTGDLKAGESKGMEPWQCVFPSANLMAPIFFSDQENSLCLELLGFKIFGNLHQLEETHNTHLSMMRSFGERKNEIKDRLPPNTKATGGFIATKAEKLALLPYTADMNSLIREIVTSIDKDMATALYTLEELKRLFHKKLGVRFLKPEKIVAAKSA